MAEQTMSTRKSTHVSGMAGEFFVMEVLYRLGHQPALTMGDAKKIDILSAVSARRTIRISVKTVRGGGKWPVGKSNLAREKDLFFVFLYYRDFTDVTLRPQAFVISSATVEKLKREWFDSYAIFFSNAKDRKLLEPYKEAWDILGKQ